MPQCILHQGTLDSKGYGRVRVEGKPTTAHRAAYCAAKGIRPVDIKGLVVRHKCDNPPCVNPEHLEVGTYQDNSNDMVVRGRASAGSRHYVAKLADEQVEEIRSRYKWRCPVNGGKALAEEFGVGRPAISNIVNGRTYVEPEP